MPPGEEEPIALHALVGGKEHPDFQNCKYSHLCGSRTVLMKAVINIVHNLY